MTRHFRYALTVSSVLAAIAAAAPAMAQADNSATSGDIIVTARRSEERLQDVPISISVINQTQINERNIVQGSDLAVYTPSLTVNQRFGPETSSFAIRGFLQEANTAPSVGVYFADVTTPRSLGLTAAGSNLAIGAFMDLENTQILKGPQGTLFGRNTTGGAILLVPHKPTDRLEGYVEASAGDYGMWRGQAVLNVPLSDTFKIRLGVDRMKRDGYMNNRSGIGPSDYNNTDYFYARASILADLTPDLQNYFVAHYSNSDTNGFASRIVACNRTPSAATAFTAALACAQLDRMNAANYGPLDTEVAVPDPMFKVEQWQVINTTTLHASDELTIKNIASYSEITSDLRYSLAGENFILGPTSRFSTTTISTVPGAHSNDQSTFTEELQLQGNTLDGRLKWQAGGYLEISESPSFNEGNTIVFMACQNLATLQCTDVYGAIVSQALGSPTPVGNISNARQKSTFINKALYAQATYSISDKFSVTGGLRYTSDITKAINEATRYLYFPPITSPTGTNPIRICNDRLTFGFKIIADPALCRKDFRTTSSKPTWTIDLDYKPTPDLMFYGKYSRGYRAGGIAVLNLGLETWQPEKLDTYELGLKASFHGAVRGYFNAAAFYNDFTNQQLVSTTRDKVTGVAQGNAILNAGSSTIKGFEIDSAITLFDSLDLALGYTYLDTKIKKLVVPVSPIYNLDLLVKEGDPLPQVPKNRINISAKYTLPLDESTGRISFGATFVHTDKQFFNRNSAPGYVNLPASDVLNLNANWDHVLGKPVDLSVFVTNVTNELIDVVHGGEYASIGYESVQYAAPRMWGVRLRYSFGE
jgi:iron complex outermembrane receptor protein